MKYKKVYVEITNCCNLACDFCIQNKRKEKMMTKEEFLVILAKLKNHTKYLYFHVLGEPLLHPLLKEFTRLASKEGFQVNITTNGYLIDRLETIFSLHQVNISLHSFDPRYGISLESYLNSIFEISEQLLKNKTAVSLRLWVTGDQTAKILKAIEANYHISITERDLQNRNFKIKEYLFLNTFHPFQWPDMENETSREGTCYGLIDHFGILVDGTIVPCCLDSKGELALGNIFKDELEIVLKQPRVLKMKQGFRDHQKVEELCQKCHFLKEQ